MASSVGGVGEPGYSEVLDALKKLEAEEGPISTMPVQTRAARDGIHQYFYNFSIFFLSFF
jgi:hypothetical protein